jgi:DNA (cytosine-5)-methyltransferase 1
VNSKPRLLDLFCGAGGAAMGYSRAGFEVVGVDIKPQPRYPFEFAQADALEVLCFLTDYKTFRYYEARDIFPQSLGEDFDAFHASPPCQAYTKAQVLQGKRHPDLIGPTRTLLRRTDMPYVIENVKRSPLRDPVVLEGQMFGLNTHRPRLFETNWPLEVPALIPPPPPQAKMGRKPRGDQAIQVVGNFSDVAAGRAAMGIDWMTRDELSEAIPPAYTELIGHQLMQHVRARAAA